MKIFLIWKKIWPSVLYVLCITIIPVNSRVEKGESVGEGLPVDGQLMMDDVRDKRPACLYQ